VNASQRAQLGSIIWILIAAVAVAIFVGGHWRWGPFVVGVAVAVAGAVAYGLLGTINNEAILRIGAHKLTSGHTRLATARSAARDRLLTHCTLIAGFGLALGIASAGLGSWWPDVAQGVWTALLLLVTASLG